MFILCYPTPYVIKIHSVYYYNSYPSSEKITISSVWKYNRIISLHSQILPSESFICLCYFISLQIRGEILGIYRKQSDKEIKSLNMQRSIETIKLDRSP